MPSERVQRQIDHLLDEAEAAVSGLDWPRVRQIGRGVLAVDPDNQDALAFLAMADAADPAPQPGPAASQPPVAPAPAAPPLPSAFASGRYQVRAFLGEGARKRVYLAHDARLARDVAVAVIKTEGLDLGGRERIQREAQAMARLGSHPNVVTVFDTAEEEGQPIMVCEYMAGGSLDELIAKRRNTGCR